jgi:uncharacterized Zn finger protein
MPTVNQQFPVPVSCPYCGLPMEFMRRIDDAAGSTYLFRCAHCGGIELPPDGRMRRQAQ